MAAAVGQVVAQEAEQTVAATTALESAKEAVIKLAAAAKIETVQQSKQTFQASNKTITTFLTETKKAADSAKEAAAQKSSLIFYKIFGSDEQRAADVACEKYNKAQELSTEISQVEQQLNDISIIKHPDIKGHLIITEDGKIEFHTDSIDVDGRVQTYNKKSSDPFIIHYSDIKGYKSYLSLQEDLKDFLGLISEETKNKYYISLGTKKLESEISSKLKSFEDDIKALQEMSDQANNAKNQKAKDQFASNRPAFENIKNRFAPNKELEDQLFKIARLIGQRISEIGEDPYIKILNKRFQKIFNQIKKIKEDKLIETINKRYSEIFPENSISSRLSYAASFCFDSFKNFYGPFISSSKKEIIDTSPKAISCISDLENSAWDKARNHAVLSSSIVSALTFYGLSFMINPVAGAILAATAALPLSYNAMKKEEKTIFSVQSRPEKDDPKLKVQGEAIFNQIQIINSITKTKSSPKSSIKELREQQTKLSQNIKKCNDSIASLQSIIDENTLFGFIPIKPVKKDSELFIKLHMSVMKYKEITPSEKIDINNIDGKGLKLIDDAKDCLAIINFILAKFKKLKKDLEDKEKEKKQEISTSTAIDEAISSLLKTRE